jgi:hypothetical protein
MKKGQLKFRQFSQNQIEDLYDGLEHRDLLDVRKQLEEQARLHNHKLARFLDYVTHLGDGPDEFTNGYDFEEKTDGTFMYTKHSRHKK